MQEALQGLGVPLEDLDALVQILGQGLHCGDLGVPVRLRLGLRAAAGLTGFRRQFGPVQRLAGFEPVEFVRLAWLLWFLRHPPQPVYTRGEAFQALRVPYARACPVSRETININELGH